MASYKVPFMDALTSLYEMRLVSIKGKPVPVYSNHFDDILCTIDLDSIARNAELKGRMSPQAIVQYFLYVPEIDKRPMPMIAFIWSWGGPWAYVYNVYHSMLSECGGLVLSTIKNNCR